MRVCCCSSCQAQKGHSNNKIKQQGGTRDRVYMLKTKKNTLNISVFFLFLSINSPELEVDSRQYIKMTDKCWGGKLRRGGGGEWNKYHTVCLREKKTQQNTSDPKNNDL